MPKDKIPPQEPENRFLDLSCVPDFQIAETDHAVTAAKIEKAKEILDEILQDKVVKGQLRKKMLAAFNLLDNEEAKNGRDA